MTPISATTVTRLPRREQTQMVPCALGHGLFQVDGTWGTVQPIELEPGVRTIGECELIEHLERGLQVIDTRRDRFLERGTIPGAKTIPHDEIVEHLDELDDTAPTVFYCNGPQCAATPDAIRRLLDAGYPPRSILYYRGGIHDWMTLGYPLVSPES
jgi:rhodanese-related sulfurtransferase